MRKNKVVKSCVQGILIALLSFSALDGFAQERGQIKNTPKINQNSPKKKETKEEKPTPKEKSDDFEVETQPTRIQNQFEPVKPVNPVVHEDTTSIDEGELMVVEMSDSVQIGDDLVKTADYFTIWDANSINPYGINPLEFDENVVLRLYNEEEGRAMKMPLERIRVTSQFGFRWGRNHTGTDLDLDTGDPIMSVFDGIVRVVGTDGRGYGKFVVVRHYNGLETLYAHMSRQFSESGQFVKAGDILGLGGSTGRSTGPHLHFETRYEGNPFDPRHIFDWEKSELRSKEFELTKSVWDYRRGAKSYKSEFEASDPNPKVVQTMFHKVRSGDNLIGIARKYGTTVQNLTRMNRITPRTTLRIGQKIRVR